MAELLKLLDTEGVASYNRISQKLWHSDASSAQQINRVHEIVKRARRVVGESALVLIEESYRLERGQLPQHSIGTPASRSNKAQQRDLRVERTISAAQLRRLLYDPAAEKQETAVWAHDPLGLLANSLPQFVRALTKRHYWLIASDETETIISLAKLADFCGDDQKKQRAVAERLRIVLTPNEHQLPAVVLLSRKQRFVLADDESAAFLQATGDDVVRDLKKQITGFGLQARNCVIRYSTHQNLAGLQERFRCACDVQRPDVAEDLVKSWWPVEKRAPQSENKPGDPQERGNKVRYERPE